MPDEVTATLDDVMTKLEAIEGKLTSLTNQVKGLGYIGGEATAQETGVNTAKVFVVSPWPPETTEEESNEDDSDSNS